MCVACSSSRSYVQRDTSQAQAGIALQRKAAETTQGLIKLNIGGVKYTTSLATLMAVPDAYFSSGDWQQVLTAEGEVFMDRDGEVTYVAAFLALPDYVQVTYCILVPVLA